MLEQSNPWRAWIVSLLIAIMPLSFALPVRAKAVPAAILFLGGLWLLVSSPEARRACRRAYPVLLTSLLLFVFSLVNIAAHGIDWREFDVASHILAFVGIALNFAGPLRTVAIRIGFSVSAGVLGVICIHQHFVQGIDRAYGVNNGFWGAIEFAMFMLVLALIAITQALRRELTRGERLLHLLGAALSTYGALLTQSRGPLLAFIPVFAALVLIQARRTRRWREGLITLVLGVLAALAAATTLHSQVATRFAAVTQEMSTYSEQEATGAVRERLEMWRTAGMAVIEHPLAGIGINQFGPYARAKIAEGEVNPVVAKYDHPHSEYLEWASTGGVPGAIVIVLLFGTGIFFFGKHAFDPRNDVALAASGGLATVGMYALCGMTDNVFYRPMPHSLYFFITLGLAVYIGHALDRRGPQAGIP